MATPTLAVSSATVPFGGTADVTVTFATPPGRTLDIALFDSGAQVATGTVTFDGEPAPVVSVGATDVGWELRTSAGTLTALGENKFRLTNG